MHELPNYDHYSFVEVRRPRWDSIISEFRSLSSDLRKAKNVGDIQGKIGTSFESSMARFAEDFSSNCISLATAIDELIDWLSETLKTHESVSVLGI